MKKHSKLKLFTVYTIRLSVNTMLSRYITIYLTKNTYIQIKRIIFKPIIIISEQQHYYSIAHRVLLNRVATEV